MQSRVTTLIQFCPAILLLCWLTICIAGIDGLTSNASYRVYFDPADSTMPSQKRFESDFSRHDNLLLIVSEYQTNSDQPIQEQLRIYYKPLSDQLLALPQITAIRGFNGLSDGGTPGSGNVVNQYIANHERAGLIELDVQLADSKSAAELASLRDRIRSIAQQTLPTRIDIKFGGPLALNLA